MRVDTEFEPFAVAAIKPKGHTVPYASEFEADRALWILAREACDLARVVDLEVWGDDVGLKRSPTLEGDRYSIGRSLCRVALR